MSVLSQIKSILENAAEVCSQVGMLTLHSELSRVTNVITSTSGHRPLHMAPSLIS